MRNPFKHHLPDATPEQIDRAYTSQGWGVKLERRVPRASGGEPLYFQLRLPNDTAWKDLDDVSAAGTDEKTTEEAAEAQSLIAEQTKALVALGESPEVVLRGAIVHGDDPSNVYATLSVLYMSLTDMPEGFMLPEPEGWDSLRHEQTRLSKNVQRDMLLIARYPERDDDAQVLGTQQYALATELGSLVMLFARWGGGSGNGRTFGFWDSVSHTAYLGEQPAGIVEQIT